MDDSKMIYGNDNGMGFIMGALLSNGGLYGNRQNYGGYNNYDNCQAALSNNLMDSVNRNGSAIGQTKDMLSNSIDHVQAAINQGMQNLGQCVNDGFANTNLNVCNGLAQTNQNISGINQRISDQLNNGFMNTNQNIFNASQTLGKCISDGFQQSLLNDCQNTNMILNNQNMGFANTSKEICAGINNLTLQNCQNTHLMESKIEALSSQLKDNEIGRLSDEKATLQSQLFTCNQNQELMEQIRACCCPPCPPKTCSSGGNNNNDINIVLQQVQGLANGLSALANEVGSLQSVVRKQKA